MILCHFLLNPCDFLFNFLERISAGGCELLLDILVLLFHQLLEVSLLVHQDLPNILASFVQLFFDRFFEGLKLRVNLIQDLWVVQLCVFFLHLYPGAMPRILDLFLHVSLDVLYIYGHHSLELVEHLLSALFAFLIDSSYNLVNDALALLLESLLHLVESVSLDVLTDSCLY